MGSLYFSRPATFTLASAGLVGLSSLATLVVLYVRRLRRPAPASPPAGTDVLSAARFKRILWHEP